MCLRGRADLVIRAEHDSVTRNSFAATLGGRHTFVLLGDEYSNEIRAPNSFYEVIPQQKKAALEKFTRHCQVNLCLAARDKIIQNFSIYHLSPFSILPASFN